MLKYVTVIEKKCSRVSVINSETKTLSDSMSNGKEDQSASNSDPSSAQKFQLVVKKGDLFSCPDSHSLAHCISADIRLGKGIATLFRNKFGGIDDLKKQGARPGGLAVLTRGRRYIYNLVTKEKYWHKPTYSTMESSLTAMKSHCEEHGVTDLSMPMIGCGLDGLQWDRVESLITEVFTGTDVAITVYKL